MPRIIARTSVFGSVTLMIFAVGLFLGWKGRFADAQRRRDKVMLNSQVITLMDEKGNMRASLSTTADGTPVFVLFDNKGLQKMVIAAGPQDNVIELAGPTGTNCATLRVDKDGKAALKYFDAEGKRRLNLALEEESLPSLEMSDKEGNKRLRLGLSKDGSPSLEFYDKAGKLVSSRPHTVD